MSKYFTQWDDFDVDTIDTNVAGWTTRGTAAPNGYAPAYGAPAVKKRYLNFKSNSSGVPLRNVVSANVLDADANRANIELLSCFSVDAATVTDLTLVVRGVGASGAAASEGYLARCELAGNIYISKRSSTTAISTVATVAFTFSAGKSYFVRFRANGTSLKLRVWDAALGSAGEPATWNIDTTDASFSAAGWAGLGGFGASADLVAPWNFFAVGTNGDTAVCPRTNAEYSDFLSSQTSVRAVLAKMRFTGYDSSASPYTATRHVYLANHGYISHEQDSPSRQRFDNYITGVPTFSREMPAALSGQATVNLGKLRVSNPAETPKLAAYKAVDLNGTSQYIYAASSSSLNFGTGSFSVMLRGRFDDFTYPRTFPSFGKPGAAWNTSAGWGVGAGYYTTSVFVFFNDGTNHVQGNIALDAGFRPADLIGQFVELILIVDRVANTARIMVNGVLQSGSVSLSALTGSVNNTEQFKAGVSVGWYQDGLIDEVRAWSRALAQSEGVAIYRQQPVNTVTNMVLLWKLNEGTGTSAVDSSGSGNTGTLVGSPTWVTGKRTLVGVEVAANRDDWLRIHWQRDGFELLMGDPSWPLHDFRHIVRGRLGNPTAPDIGVLEFPIADMSEALQADIQPSLFTSGDYVDQRKPIFMGQIGRASHVGGQIEPPQTDSVNLIYTLSDAAVGAWYSSLTNYMKCFDNQVELRTSALTCSAVAGNEITFSVPHGMVVNYLWRSPATGTLPTPLTSDTDYWVQSASTTSKITLSATRGGAVITLTSTTLVSSASYGYGYTVTTTAPVTIQLAATPAGRITVSNVMGSSVAPYDTGNTPGEIYRDIVTRAGLTANYIEPNLYSYSNDAGYWVDTLKHSCNDIANDVASRTLTRYGFTPDGLFSSGLIELPAATAQMTFTASNVKINTLRLTDVVRPVDFSKAQIITKPWFLTAGLFQAGSREALQGGTYGTGSASGAGTPLDDYSQYQDADTTYVFSSIYTTAFNYYLTLFKHKLGIFEFETTLPASELSIGDTISLDFPRLGWKQYTAADPASPDNTATIDSRLAVVIGINVNLDAPGPFKVKIKCFRRVVGLYPTENLN